MRQIITKQDKEKKDARNKLILGIVLAALMLFSTAGYAFFSNPSASEKRKVTYKNYEFNLGENGFWVFYDSSGTYAFYTSYNPYETENISSPYVSLSTLSGKPLYYSGDQRTFSEIYQNFQYFVPRAQEVCLLGEECNKDLPVKNCSENIIVIKADYNSSKEVPANIKKSDNCVYISSESEELLKAADSFIFRSFGITD